MKIIIYLGHPAQYHFFKNIIRGLKTHGHELKILIKSKDILENLVLEDGLIAENILQENRGNSKSSMFRSMLIRDIRVLKIALDFKPDILLGSDTCVAHVGRLLSKPCLTVGEDDYAIVKKIAWLLMPFTNYILSPISCDLGYFKYKKVSYQGYMKLAYLHPNIFIPSYKGLETLTQTKFCIIRLAKLTAHHDNNIQGLTDTEVLKIIDVLETKKINVLIDSEYQLPESLKMHKLTIPKNRMHDLMSYAEMIISDSQSMSVEAAMLGVPSIRFNSFVGKIGVLNELEQVYGLTFGIKPENPEELFNKLDELINQPNLKLDFATRRQKMLSDKIDVTAFFVWFIENYPESAAIMKNNPDYQLRFK